MKATRQVVPSIKPQLCGFILAGHPTPGHLNTPAAWCSHTCTSVCAFPLCSIVGGMGKAQVVTLTECLLPMCEESDRTWSCSSRNLQLLLVTLYKAFYLAASTPPLPPPKAPGLSGTTTVTISPVSLATRKPQIWQHPGQTGPQTWTCYLSSSTCRYTPSSCLPLSPRVHAHPSEGASPLVNSASHRSQNWHTVDNIYCGCIALCFYTQWAQN